MSLFCWASVVRFMFIQDGTLTQEQEAGKIIHLFMWYHLLNVIEYAQAFTLFDRDEDGLINPKELSILIRSLEHNPSDNEIQQLIDQIADTGLFSRSSLS